MLKFLWIAKVILLFISGMLVHSCKNSRNLSEPKYITGFNHLSAEQRYYAKFNGPFVSIFFKRKNASWFQQLNHQPIDLSIIGVTGRKEDRASNITRLSNYIDSRITLLESQPNCLGASSPEKSLRRIAVVLLVDLIEEAYNSPRTMCSRESHQQKQGGRSYYDDKLILSYLIQLIDGVTAAAFQCEGDYHLRSIVSPDINSFLCSG